MYEYKITEIVKIVDGDTIDVIIDIGFNILRKERIRLSRIDTPESNSKDEKEKLLAFEAKEFLSLWLVDQNELKIKTTKDDKYGRYLGEIYGDQHICINDVLINKGYAWEYDGGTKKKDLNILLEKRK